MKRRATNVKVTKRATAQPNANTNANANANANSSNGQEKEYMGVVSLVQFER